MNVYKKTMGTVLIKHDDNFYVVNGRDVYKVNEVGARIFDLCDGKNDLDSICDTLSKFYSLSQDEIREDILSYVNDLRDLMLIKQVS